MLALSVILWLAGCVLPDESEALPADGFLSSTGAALGEMAICLDGFPGSEAQAQAAAWRALAQRCPGEVYGAGGAPATCGAAPSAVAALRGDKEVAFGLPRTELGLVSGTASRDEQGRWRAEARLPGTDESGALALLVPSETPPGTNILSHASAILHARVRTASGIDIAALVPQGTQADELFNLKSALLSRAVLDGTWELAVYPAPAGQIMPDAVLAAGVHEAAARPAIESFAGQLRDKWSVQRSPTTVGAWHGECVKGLRVLPGLEPCWLMDDDRLVVGWNRGALVQAVESAPTPLDLGENSGLTIDFTNMAVADAMLSSQVDPAVRGELPHYPFNSLTVRLKQDKGALLASLAASEACHP